MQKSTSRGVFEIVLSVILILLGILIIFLEFSKNSGEDQALKQFNIYFKQFKRNPTYENLYLLLSCTLDNNKADILKALKQCSLSNETKNYILNLLGSLEQAQFSKATQTAQSKKIEYSHLKALKKLIKEQDEAN